MKTTPLAWIALLLLLVLAGGCVAMDPNMYRGSGTTPPPQPKPRAVGQAPSQEGASQPGAKDDAIRIMPAQPTLPTASPDNVAITVEKLGINQETAADADLAFRYAHGDVAVASPGAKLAQRNGLRVAVGGDNFRARLGASARRTQSASRESMFIVVRSGTEGFIQAGEDVFVQRLGYWTPLGYQLLAQQAFVGRQLVVRPTILPGNRVQIELWPRFTARGARGAIDVTELSTSVIVGDGQSIVLGGMTTGSNDVAAVLFGVGSRQRAGMMTIVLTPKIGGLPLDWRALEKVVK